MITQTFRRKLLTNSQVSSIATSQLADPTVTEKPSFTLELLLGNDNYIRLLKPAKVKY